MKRIKTLKSKDVEFALEILEEDIPVRGNAMACGDDAEDREFENEIIARLDSGDLWAWCTVRVTATWGEFEGEAYLGGCCYRDEEDFKAKGGYYPDMCSDALADLNARIKQAVAQVAPLVECR